MDQPRERKTERLKEAVHSARASVQHSVSQLEDRVHKATDIREQVRAHPIVALSVAALAGIVIGRQIVSLLGITGIATLGARTVLRSTGSASSGQIIADRLINNAGSVLTSAVLVPLVTSLREPIESATRQLANRSHAR